jgi:hypothetical protein
LTVTVGRVEVGVAVMVGVSVIVGVNVMVAVKVGSMVLVASGVLVSVGGSGVGVGAWDGRLHASMAVNTSTLARYERFI